VDEQRLNNCKSQLRAYDTKRCSCSTKTLPSPMVLPFLRILIPAANSSFENVLVKLVHTAGHGDQPLAEFAFVTLLPSR